MSYNYKQLVGKVAPKTLISAENNGNTPSITPEAKLRDLPSFKVSLDNTTAFDVKMLVGDTLGLNAHVHGLGSVNTLAEVEAAATNDLLVEPTGGSVPYPLIKASFRNPVVVKELIIESESSSKQLKEDIKLFLADIGGDGASSITRLSEQTTENQFNEKTKRFMFPNGITLSEFRALTMRVLKNESVTLTFKIAVAHGRN